MLANLLISLQMIYYFASLYFYIPWGFQISIHRCKSKYLCHYLNLRREMKIYAHKINEFLLFSKLYNFIYLYNIANMHIIFIYIHGYLVEYIWDKVYGKNYIFLTIVNIINLEYLVQIRFQISISPSQNVVILNRLIIK